MKRSVLFAATAAMSLLTALYSSDAKAVDMIQFDDSGEAVRILLNGTAVTGNIGPISNYSTQTVAEPGGGLGEIIWFDYFPVSNIPVLSDGSNHQLPYVYTQLYEPGVAGQLIVSDEFGIRPIIGNNGLPTGGFNVVFTSADQALLPPLFTTPLVASPLSALEINGYQNVGFVVEHNANATAVAIFQVNSVPEAGTAAMLAAGLGALGLLLRRRTSG